MTNADMFQEVFGFYPYLPVENGYILSGKLEDVKWMNAPFRRIIGNNIHGEWKHKQLQSDNSAVGYFLSTECECSICGTIVEQESNFCPYCGADMRTNYDELQRL